MLNLISKQLAPPLTADFYAESYELRKTASTMTPVTINWFCQKAKALLARKELASANKTFTVLSVGCGEGDIDIEIIQALSQQLSPQWDRLRYVALEPNIAQRSRFLQRLATVPLDSRVEVVVHDHCFKDLDKCKPEEHFDLILFVHVFYYFDTPQRIVPDALKLVKPEGQIVIVHQTLLAFLKFSSNI